jgi:hypothetical protein
LMGFWSRRLGTNVAALMGGTSLGAVTLLGSETDGLAIDFTDASLFVRDTTTTSNEWNAANGDVQTFWRDRSFTSYASPSPKITRDSSGNYTYRPHNLVPVSENMLSGYWSQSGLNAIAAYGSSDPFGTTTAVTLTDSGALTGHRLRGDGVTVTVTASVPYTYSVYVKAGTLNYAFISIYGAVAGHYISAAFDLTGGSAASETSVGATSGTIISTSQTSVGNGWYRLTITGHTTQTSALPLVGTASAATGNSWATSGQIQYTGSGSGTIHTTGAMLNAGPAALTYTKTAAHNLVLQSQVLGTSWTATSVTVGNNATTAPDGTTTAESLALVDASATHQLASTTIAFTTGLTYTFSLYAKANTHGFVQLAFPTGSSTFAADAYANFNLSTGATSAGAGATAVATLVGDSWYRCSITATATASATTAPLIVLVSAIGAVRAETWDPNSTNSAYGWGAQVELASSPGKYVATTTAASYSAVYELPREWDSSGVCQGLLVEEARTNLCLRSDELDNASWSLVPGVTISANATTAPNGLTTADKIVEKNGAADQLIYQTIAVTAVAYTCSVWVKAGERTWAFVCINDGGAGDHGTYINLATGALGTTVGTITSKSVTTGPNGWYRVSVTKTLTAANWAVVIGPATADGAARPSYSGDGASGIYAGGAQLEAGAFATSPIYTGSASVTRAGDLGVRAATSVMAYSQSAVTLYAKGTPQNLDASATVQALLGTDDATSNERHLLYRASANPQSITVDGGVTQADVDGGAWAVSTSGKIAASMAANDVAISFNGGAAVTDTSATMPAVHTIGIGNTNSLTPFNGHIAQIMILPRAMTDGELQTVTT